MDRLVGKLAMPPWPGPHPLIVMAPGADAELVPASVPDEVVTRLAAAGLASLSYDRPGTGESSGDWRLATVAEQALELEAAVDAGREALGGDCGPTAVCADGESGWAALRVAHERWDLTGLILVQVPVRGSVVRLQRDLTERFLRQDFGADEAALAGAILKERIRRLAEGDPPTAVLGSEAACRSTSWYGLLPGNDPDESVVLARRATHDAEPDLVAITAEGVGGPAVLVIGLDGGTADVDPEAPALDRAFAGGGEGGWAGTTRRHRVVTLAADGDDSFWGQLGAVELIVGWVLGLGADLIPTGKRAPDRSAPDRSAPDRSAPDQSAPDRSAVHLAGPDRDASGASSTGRSLIDWVLSKTN